MKTIFLGGIHGVGKSTIIKGLKGNDENIGHYSFGENVRDIGKETGVLRGARDLSGINNDTRNNLMKIARERFKELISSQAYDILLVDNHFSVYEDKQLIKAVDDEEISMYDKFVLVETPLNILLERISKDSKQRIVEAFDIEKISRHVDFERDITNDIRSRFNIDLLLVENIDINQTIKKVKEFVS